MLQPTRPTIYIYLILIGIIFLREWDIALFLEKRDTSKELLYIHVLSYYSMMEIGGFTRLADSA